VKAFLIDLELGFFLPAARALLYSTAMSCLMAALLVLGFLLSGRPLDEVALYPPLVFFNISATAVLGALTNTLGVLGLALNLDADITLGARALSRSELLETGGFSGLFHSLISFY